MPANHPNRNPCAIPPTPDGDFHPASPTSPVKRDDTSRRPSSFILPRSPFPSMLHRIPESRITAIIAAVSAFPKGAKLVDVMAKFPNPPPRRTMQYWLQSLAAMGRLRIRGSARSTRYSVAKGYIPPRVEPPQSAPISHAVSSANAVSSPNPPQPSAPTRRILPPDIPAPLPTTVAPAPSATATASPYAGRRNNPRLQAAYLERLEFAIPRLVRQMIYFGEAAAFFRREAAMHFNAADQEGFVAAGLAELANLTDANRSKYRLGPAEFSTWLAKCGPHASRPQF